MSNVQYYRSDAELQLEKRLNAVGERIETERAKYYHFLSEADRVKFLIFVLEEQHKVLLQEMLCVQMAAVRVQLDALTNPEDAK